MNITVLDPVGAEVTDLDPGEPDPGTVAHLRRLLAEHGVLIMPGQSIDDDGFLGFLRAFGELAFTKGEASAPGYPDLNVVSNVGRTTPPRSTFHVDSTSSAVPRPTRRSGRCRSRPRAAKPCSPTSTALTTRYRAKSTTRSRDAQSPTTSRD